MLFRWRILRFGCPELQRGLRPRGDSALALRVAPPTSRYLLPSCRTPERGVRQGPKGRPREDRRAERRRCRETSVHDVPRHQTVGLVGRLLNFSMRGMTASDASGVGCEPDRDADRSAGSIQSRVGGGPTISTP